MYETGTGAIDVRARSHVEGNAIVVTELPFGVSKGGDVGVIRQIVDLCGAGSLTELRELRDDSNRAGMRIVVSLRHGANTRAALEKLHAHTSLQSTFHVDFVALIDGARRRLPLIELIARFLDRRDTATARRELYAIATAFGDDRITSIES